MVIVVVGDEEDGSSAGPTKALLGIPWTPKLFLAEALKCNHPFDECIPVPPVVARAWKSILENPPSFTIQKRVDVLQHYSHRVEALKVGEASLHGSLSKGVEAVCKQKNILIFKEMLKLCV